MSNQIRMTPDTMRAKAQRYMMEAQKMDEIINNMKKMLGELQSEWEGDASRAYSERYAQLEPGFKAASELIKEISAALNASANIVERTDLEIGSKFRA